MAQLQFSINDTINWGEGYGDAHDGDLTISSNTTDTSANTGGLSGTIATKTATVTSNTGFAIGDIVRLDQTRHSSNHGIWQFNRITNISGTTITFQYDLVISFNSTGDNDAQMYECKQYANVTIDSTKTFTGQAYDRSTGKGGIFWFFVAGQFINNGIVNVNSKGFIGGAGGNAGVFGGLQGDSYKNNGTDSEGVSANEGGGGRGDGTADSDGAGGGAGGGYNGNGGAGSNGGGGSPGIGGNAGISHGDTTLVLSYLGSGGGGGGYDQPGTNNGGAGGRGAGIFGFCAAYADISSGQINSVGANGGNGTNFSGAGGGGTGGTVFGKAEILIIGTDKINFAGGTKGTGSTGGNGGDGAKGRCRFEYGSSLSGTITNGVTAQDKLLTVTQGGLLLALL